VGRYRVPSKTAKNTKIAKKGQNPKMAESKKS